MKGGEGVNACAESNSRSSSHRFPLAKKRVACWKEVAGVWRRTFRSVSEILSVSNFSVLEFH